MRNNLTSAFLVMMGVSLLTACDTLPALEAGPQVSTSQIVDRIKCEVAAAAAPFLAQNEKGDALYPWFRKWTASFDLTLQVADQTGINPSVVFVEPIAPAILPGIGSITRNFNLNASGGYNSTATRTEGLSFTLALKDFEGEAKKLACGRLAEDRDLNANLGVSEWLASAFDPISRGKLDHAAPKPATPKTKSVSTGKALPKNPTPTSSQFSAAFRALSGQFVLHNAPDVLEQLKKLPEQSKPEPENAADALQRLLTSPGTSPNVNIPDFELWHDKALYSMNDFLPADVQKYSDYLDALISSVEAIGKKAGSAEVELQLEKRVTAQSAAGHDEIITLRHYASDFHDFLIKCQSAVRSYLHPSPPKIADPVDLITHQVNFVVALIPTFTDVDRCGPKCGGR